LPKNHLSPFIVLRCLPITHWVSLATIAAMGLFNVAVIVLHAFDDALFQQWLRFAAPTVAFISRFVPAIDHLSRFMTRVGYSSRIDVVRDVISVDWSIYVIGLSVMVLSFLLDFLLNGLTVSRALYQKVRSVIDGRIRYDTLIIFYLGFFVLCFVLIFTDGLYSELYLYQSDLGLASSIFFFSGALTFPVAMLALCVAFVWQALCRDHSETSFPRKHR
jgi:hypothetical protein